MFGAFYVSFRLRRHCPFLKRRLRLMFPLIRFLINISWFWSALYGNDDSRLPERLGFSHPSYKGRNGFGFDGFNHFLVFR
jgi:hypothetical protein